MQSSPLNGSSAPPLKKKRSRARIFQFRKYAAAFCRSSPSTRQRCLPEMLAGYAQRRFDVCGVFSQLDEVRFTTFLQAKPSKSLLTKARVIFTRAVSGSS